MGPRLGSRGKAQNLGQVAEFLLKLQWGRDLEVAESNACHKEARHNDRLQWGRDLEVAERGDATRPKEMSYCQASMGPRLGSRGKTQGPQRQISIPRCFNGAATWKSRKDELARIAGVDADGFNGAATWKSRKEPRSAFLCRLDPCFNGAATWKSRKGSVEDLSAGTESASMGPRLGSRGKSTWARRLAMPM